MRAAVLTSFGQPLQLVDRPDPSASGEQVVVRVRACGVCGSDVHLSDGKLGQRDLPLVLGHEIAGDAEGLGSVLVYGMWGCGSCTWCQRQEYQFCARAVSPGFERDGGYAEALVVPSPRFLVPLFGLDPVRAAPLADAGVTSYRAVRRATAGLDDGAPVLVIGAGGLGQFAVQWLRCLTTARVLVLDLDEQKLQRAVDLGADEVFRSAEHIRPVRAVIDLVGTDGTLATGARLVEAGGSLVLVGEAGGSLRFRIGCVPWETSFTTSIWGSIADLRDVVDHVRAGAIEWNVETMPLDDAEEALHRLRTGQADGRLVLVPGT
jgi:propanol-preferring alcohol dehydrogenase